MPDSQKVKLQGIKHLATKFLKSDTTAQGICKIQNTSFFATPFSRKRILAQILKHDSLAQLSPTLLKCLFMGWGKGGSL